MARHPATGSLVFRQCRKFAGSSDVEIQEQRCAIFGTREQGCARSLSLERNNVELDEYGDQICLRGRHLGVSRLTLDLYRASQQSLHVKKRHSYIDLHW